MSFSLFKSFTTIQKVPVHHGTPVLTKSFSPKIHRCWMSGIVTKHQLEQFIQNGRNKKDREYVLVDVREPSELQTQGNIESSINIPLGQLNDALKLSPEEFKAKYKAAKFGQGDFVIFSCKAGIRAQTACDVAEAQGFKNVHNYKGSAAEWFGL